MNKVYKYATGATIPEGAVFLSTQVETASGTDVEGTTYTTNNLVWHYFLVSVEEIK